MFELPQYSKKMFRDRQVDGVTTRPLVIKMFTHLDLYKRGAKCLNCFFRSKRGNVRNSLHTDHSTSAKKRQIHQTGTQKPPIGTSKTKVAVATALVLSRVRGKAVG